MNRPNGVRAAYAAFLLCAAVGFGHTTVLHTLEEAYPYHSIVFRRRLASFTKVH